jgi:hypothetical protein
MAKKTVPIILIVLALGAASFLSWYYFGNRPAANPPVSVEVKKGLVLENIKANDVVSSPLQIIGYVHGEGWYGFEGQVGTASIYDSNNNLLDIKPLTATTDWMTSTVRFEVNLEFFTTSTSGTVVFKNENASGEIERDKTVVLPVQFAPMGDALQLQAYFSNSKLDPQITCEKVFAVTRIVPKTEGVARAALEELLKGPTMTEEAAGYVTNINLGVQIKSLRIDNGVAKVDFNEAIEHEVGGSCRVTAIRSQIVSTLNQFATVKSVVISVNGRTEDILQP